MFVLIEFINIHIYMHNGIRQDIESIETQEEDLKDKFAILRKHFP